MKKYKNIIFDMGNVLLDFSPFTIVSHFTNDSNIIHECVREIFYQQEWLDLDQGIMDENQAYQKIIKRVNPKYHSFVQSILDHWHEYLSERKEMIGLLSLLKEKGYKLYLFSNASLRFYTYINRFDCLNYFDQKVISADIKLSKPSHDFYRKAFDLCQINAEESFFIDDSYPNILEAYKCNCDGYVHNGSYNLLIEYLNKIEIL